MRATLLDAGVTHPLRHGRLDGPARSSSPPREGGTDFDRVEADTLVVAVGASPRELDSAKPDGERILTWTQLYNMKTLPEHLIVVGSGVTGAEFASAYMNLGAKVTLISSRDQVLPGEDQDAATVLEDVFKRGGMQVLSKSPRRHGGAHRRPASSSPCRTAARSSGSHCLMAVGSIPNTAGIGLEDAGVAAHRIGAHPGQPGRAHLGAEHLRRRRLHELLPARLRRVDAGPYRRVPRARRRRDRRWRSARSPPTSSPPPRSPRSASRRRISRTASPTASCTSCRWRPTRARR